MNKIDLRKLNDDQYEAVTTINGPIQCNSVAGAGKTRVLTYRIAYMINELNINPNNIFVSTFTKKASTEMSERLCKLISKHQVKKLTMGTFHSIGYHILKNHYRSINSPMKNFDLLSGSPVTWMMKKILKDLNIDHSGKKNTVHDYINKINELKMNLISPEQYMINILSEPDNKYFRNVMKVYDEYEKRKESQMKIDFNDMLYKVYFLFLTNDKLLKKYQNKFKYILVDESQDNNKAQYELVKMLAKPHNNIFIVGDDDQAIFSFRGANPKEFINFKNIFNDVKQINLNLNYRSRPYILNTANKLIKNNTQRVVKELKPYKTQNDNKAEYIQFNNENKEAEYVVNKIKKMKSYHDLNEIAILYRTNDQSRALEDYLVLNGIPYQIFNGISFYQRSEIKDIISYLKLIINNNNDDALSRIINKPTRYLGRKFINTTKYIAKQRNISLFEALDYNNKINYSQKENVKILKKTINFLKRQIDSNNFDNVGDIIELIINHTKYKEYLIKQNGNEEDNNKLNNIHSLISAANRYDNPIKFLKYIDIVMRNNNKNNIKTVKLMTIHKAKGLEFDSVFIIGMAEGLLPHKYAIDDENYNIEGIEEERRLAYVAITRAKENLYMSYSNNYQERSLTISRFLKECGIKQKK